jgi:hypothetical protein
VAVSIMLPLLASGYVFTLDMVVTPAIKAPELATSNYLYQITQHAFNFFLPSDVMQKFVLSITLLLMGVGAHRFITLLLPSPVEMRGVEWPSYIAGILYIFNPFVYSRFITGQYLILLGYALLPFFAISLWKFLQKPTAKQSIFVAARAVLISVVSIHTVGLAVIIAVAFGGLWLYRRRRDKLWLMAVGKNSLFAGVLAFVASSYWLVPLLLGQGQTATAITGFGAADRAAFATTGEGLGLVGNIAALQGFWADAASLYLMPADVFSLWWVPFIALWVLVGVGVWYGWRTQRGLTIAFVGIMLVAGVLAAGTPLNDWLASWLPFFAGYREPQKFVALIVLAYAYFGALGVAALAHYMQHKKVTPQYRNATMATVLMVPVLCVPLMLGGFAGQLKPRDYPADWYALNQKFKTEHTTQKVLFLPWHLYMRFNFAGRVIANPADKFFDPPVVISADPELKGAKSYNSTGDQQVIERAILPEARQGGVHMGAALQRLDIGYVMLAKEFDYQKYQYLRAQKDLQLVSDSPTLQLYKVVPIAKEQP